MFNFIKKNVKKIKNNINILENLIPLKRKFEWLILDVPCSGSGTIRRNPD